MLCLSLLVGPVACYFLAGYFITQCDLQEGAFVMNASAQGTIRLMQNLNAYKNTVMN